MGRHRSGKVAPQGRGKHRAPTNTGRNVARVAAAGVVLSAPVTVGAGVADADEGFDRNAIIACESGGDARAQNSSSSASGLYQFIDSTWRAYRGGSDAARAKDASVAEQHAAAARLFAAEGYTPWNASRSCWSGKIGAGGSVEIRNDSPKRVAPKESAPKKSAPTEDAPKRVAPKPVAPKRVAPKNDRVEVRSQVRASASTDSPKSGTHTVVSGDTLSELSLRYEGTSNWSAMYTRNAQVIGDNPDLILPGQVLGVR